MLLRGQFEGLRQQESRDKAKDRDRGQFIRGVTQQPGPEQQVKMDVAAKGHAQHAQT